MRLESIILFYQEIQPFHLLLPDFLLEPKYRINNGLLALGDGEC